MLRIKSVSVSLLFFVVVVFPAFGAGQNEGIITADRVLLRKGPGTSHAAVGRLMAGEVVRITEKTKMRDRLKKKYSHGYYWFSIAADNNRRGWVYGRYCYPLKSRKKTSPSSKGAAFWKKAFSLNEKFYLGLAVEDAYPVSDKNGLTGSEVHSLPFLRKKGHSRVLLFWLPGKLKGKILFREKKQMNTWFRLMSNEGVGEKIVNASVVTFKGRRALALDIRYMSQESAGSYRITCLKKGGRMVIMDFEVTRGPGW